MKTSRRNSRAHRILFPGLGQAIHQFVPKSQAAAPFLEVGQVKGRTLPHDDRKNVIEVPMAGGFELEQDEVFRAADPESVALDHLAAASIQGQFVVSIARKEQIDRNGAAPQTEDYITQERVSISPQRIDDEPLTPERIQEARATTFIQEHQAVNVLRGSAGSPHTHGQRADDTIASAGLPQAGEKVTKGSGERVIPNCRHDAGNVSVLDTGNAPGLPQCERGSDRRVPRGFERRPKDNGLSVWPGVAAGSSRIDGAWP